jgi:hypothetical protein
MAVLPNEDQYTAIGAVSVTPDNAAVIEPVTRGVYIGGAGDLAVTFLDGTQVTFTDIAPGMIHGMQIKQVRATGTTATDILAIY